MSELEPVRFETDSANKLDGVIWPFGRSFFDHRYIGFWSRSLCQAF